MSEIMILFSWRKRKLSFSSSVLRNSDPRPSHSELGGRICSKPQTEQDTESFTTRCWGKYFFYIQTSMNILWVDWRLCLHIL